MKVVYKHNNKEYTSDLLYYEKDGLLRCKEGSNERIRSDHYVVEHKGEEIDLCTDDIVKVWMH